MLFILIPIAWLALATIVVAACRLAARADSSIAGEEPATPRNEQAPVLSVAGLTVWECEDPVRLRGIAAALSANRPAGARRAPAARRPNGSAVHGPRVGVVRGRGVHSATRS
jgi:hypothetical protein